MWYNTPKHDEEQRSLDFLSADARGRPCGGRDRSGGRLLGRVPAAFRFPVAALGVARRGAVLRLGGRGASRGASPLRLLSRGLAPLLDARLAALLPRDGLGCRGLDSPAVPDAGRGAFPCAPAVLDHAHHVCPRLARPRRLADRLELDCPLARARGCAPRARRPANGFGGGGRVPAREDGDGHGRGRLDRLGALPPACDIQS